MNKKKLTKTIMKKKKLGKNFEKNFEKKFARKECGHFDEVARKFFFSFFFFGWAT